MTKIVQIPATVISSTTSFQLDGISTEVIEDTINPLNNRSLPVKLLSALGQIASGFNDDTTTLALKVKDDDANFKLGNILSDTNDLASTVNDAGIAHNLQGIQVLGSDGTNNVRLKTNASGQLETAVISSALPTGASTLAEQQTQTAHLDAIEDTIAAISASVYSNGNPGGLVGLAVGGRDSLGDFRQLSTSNTGALNVVPSLPAGAATEATLDLVRVAAQSIALEDFATQATLENVDQNTNAVAVGMNVNATPASSDGLSVGGVDSLGDFRQLSTTATGALNVVPSLPAGASTEATLSRIAGSLSNVDHDEIVTTYVGATDRINTVVYKKATVTVATLTLSYDGSDRLSGVVRT